MPAEVEHRGDPFQGAVAEPEDRDPAAGDRIIDAAAAGDGSVEAAGERDRGGIGDFVLCLGRGWPRWNAAAHSLSRDDGSSCALRYQR